MARKKRRPGRNEKIVGVTILGFICVIAGWLYIRQFEFNPAVTAHLKAPKGKAQVKKIQAIPETAPLFSGIDGFTAVSQPESFDKDTLSDKINGKAELYIASGFRSMVCRTFAPEGGEKARIEVFIYEMENPKSALAVFSSQRRPGSADLKLTRNAYSTDNALFFAVGGFYTEIIADKASGEIRTSLEKIAAAVLKGMSPGEESQAGDESAFLPAEGLVRDSVRLIPADVFGMPGLKNVYTAEYTLKSGQAGAFLSRRETPEMAKKLAEEYASFLRANGYRDVSGAKLPTGAVMLNMDDSFEVVFVREGFLAGVHDGRNQSVTDELTQKLYQALQGKK